jgi:hypothetical protein
MAGTPLTLATAAVSHTEPFNNEVETNKLKELDLEAAQPQSLSRGYTRAVWEKVSMTAGLWRKLT